ncbi:MAG: cytochrome C oxidase subunit IV family protein [Novosphingobium sp.]|nr:cytochrome C oxidase subunit IV family protein [Novosphingobium sp.]
MALRPLLLTWLALMVLLAATIGATFLPIGQWRQLINLTIAFAKAALIVWLFMKLRTEGPLVRLMAATAGMLLLIMATMIVADYHFRPDPFTRGGPPPVSPLATRTVRP